MFGLFSSSPAKTTTAPPAPASPETKPASTGPKPCCVCKEEKARRDECMLFSEEGEAKCTSTIDAYKQCMAGFGFKI